MKKLFTIILIISTILTVGADYNSRRTGNWNSGSTWGGSVPNLRFWLSNRAFINNGHTVTSGSLTMGGSAANQYLYVRRGGTLTINGNLTMNNRSHIIVESGGTLNITGSLRWNGAWSSFTSSGTVTINGSVNVVSAGQFNINAGTTLIRQNFSIDGAGSRATVNGTMNVLRNFRVMTNGQVRGRGTITWDSRTIGACTGSGSGLFCNNGSRLSTDGCYNLAPPKGVNLTPCTATSYGGGTTTPPGNTRRIIIID